jgi:hypothetical protein
VTRVRVLPGKAINVGTTQHHEGDVVDVDPAEARRWTDRALVEPVEESAKPARSRSGVKRTARGTPAGSRK